EDAVECETCCDADGGADERDAGGNPQHMGARCTESEADAELRGALCDAVSDDAEDADQRENKRHGGEDAEEDGEEALAAPLRVALDGFVEGEDAVGDLLIGRGRGDGGANGMEISERFVLRSNEKLGEGRDQGGVGEVDGGNGGAVD